MDSITNKIQDLKDFLQSLNSEDIPHLIALTEVNAKHCKYQIQESELQIQQYNIFSSNIGDHQHRGILIYVLKCLHASQLEVTNHFSEYVTIKIASLQ